MAYVTDNDTWAHLEARKPNQSVATSNINLSPGDGISNMMVTTTGVSGSSRQFEIKRNTSTVGETDVKIYQLGYFS